MKEMKDTCFKVPERNILRISRCLTVGGLRGHILFVCLPLCDQLPVVSFRFTCHLSGHISLETFKVGQCCETNFKTAASSYKLLLFDVTSY